MKATSLIRQQQQRLVRLLVSLEKEWHAPGVRAARVIEDVLVHLTLEESISAGLARRAAQAASPQVPQSLGARIADGAAVRVREALVKLAAAPVGSVLFGAAAGELRRRFEERIAFETQELLPRMEAEYSDAELELIGRTIARCYSSAVGCAQA